MPEYLFIAKSQSGETVKQTREAKDEYELARFLRQEGYILVSAQPKKEKKSFALPLASLLSFTQGVPFKEKMIFTRNLRVMIGAGVSLPKALDTLSHQVKSKPLQNALLGMKEEVMRGKSFSDALSEYPGIFSELFRNMVKVGEESGNLENNIAILSRQMEREQEMKSKIQSAMVYPAVIIIAMIGIGAMMLVSVVPKLAETFDDLHVELPVTTQAVIGLGDFVSQRWYFVLLILLAIFLLFRLAGKSPLGQKVIGDLSLKIPVISNIVKKTNAAYTIRNLSALISAGVPLVRSLEIISNTLGNIHYRQAIASSIEVVKKGGKLSEALKEYRGLYSLTVIQMIEVGEETGETTAILDKLGEFFEEEVTTATKNLVAIIEPVLMLIIGGVVGFFAISMIQPMYSMLEGLE